MNEAQHFKDADTHKEGDLVVSVVRDGEVAVSKGLSNWVRLWPEEVAWLIGRALPKAFEEMISQRHALGRCAAKGCDETATWVVRYQGLNMGNRDSRSVYCCKHHAKARRDTKKAYIVERKRVA